jgi:hypothetical protein
MEQTPGISLVDRVLAALRSIRIPVVRRESEVVGAIVGVLDEEGIAYRREVTVAPRCRVDLLVEGGIAIEVKRGKPNSRKVAEQVRRYAAGEDVTTVVLVTERGLVCHLEEAHGKPIRYVALSKNWGLTT